MAAERQRGKRKEATGRKASAATSVSEAQRFDIISVHSQITHRCDRPSVCGALLSYARVARTVSQIVTPSHEWDGVGTTQLDITLPSLNL